MITTSSVSAITLFDELYARQALDNSDKSDIIIKATPHKDRLTALY